MDYRTRVDAEIGALCGETVNPQSRVCEAQTTVQTIYPQGNMHRGNRIAVAAHVSPDWDENDVLRHEPWRRVN